METALEDFNIKPTQGTHFFQNIISKGIGYLHISLNYKKDYIDWNWLNEQEPERETKYVKLITFSKPLTIKLDGRSGKALILKPS